MTKNHWRGWPLWVFRFLLKTRLIKLHTWYYEWRIRQEIRRIDALYDKQERTRRTDSN
jgi:hypothetical protein